MCDGETDKKINSQERNTWQSIMTPLPSMNNEFTFEAFDLYLILSIHKNMQSREVWTAESPEMWSS